MFNHILTIRFSETAQVVLLIHNWHQQWSLIQTVEPCK